MAADKADSSDSGVGSDWAPDSVQFRPHPLHSPLHQPTNRDWRHPVVLSLLHTPSPALPPLRAYDAASRWCSRMQSPIHPVPVSTSSPGQSLVSTLTPQHQWASNDKSGSVRHISNARLVPWLCELQVRGNFPNREPNSGYQIAERHSSEGWLLAWTGAILGVRDTLRHRS